MPNLANHNVSYLQLEEKIGRPLVVVLPIVFIALAAFDKMTWENAISFCLFSTIAGYFKFRHFHKITKSLVHEVWDNGTHLLIKKHKDELRLDYDDISHVNYQFYFHLKSKYAIEIYLKQDSKFGNPICFISWADSCNYGREFHILPTKTPEMLAWVEKINQKAQQTKTTKKIQAHDKY
ncbi:hypothetical protein LU293_07740 [Moraxella nasovis]|uniref:hypothetical protein n=1 Tax=Moraxella nasovis TaxID=2904121 RepID=UPI001F609CA3|nr:hypothetical protein [Moraxella nasovis]UNU72970.1 hypothetical protein LU293_07740 [Moraxella nasovis]